MLISKESVGLLTMSISLVPFSVLALCTGDPAGCCGHIKSSCEAVDGCTWLPATPSNTYYGSCEGTPTPCDSFSDDSLGCVQQDGCTFGPNQEWSSTGLFCTGTPKSPAQCMGTAPAVCSGGEKSVCESILGCKFTPGDYWFDGFCDGTPTPCSDLSNDDCICNMQAGCTYFQDPPDPTEHFYDAIMPVEEGYRECYGPDDMYVEISPKEYIWTISVVLCEKCRPTLLGRDVCYWTYSSWEPSLVFHSCVMKIGDQYCFCEICEDGGTAFNCKDALDSSGVLDGSTKVVVGRDCSGNCIWSNSATPTPTTPYPTSQNPTSVVPITVDPTAPEPTTTTTTTEEPTTTVPTQEASSSQKPTSIVGPTTIDPTTSKPTTTEAPNTMVPTQEASFNGLTSESDAAGGSFSKKQCPISSLSMFVWVIMMFTAAFH